MPFEVVHRPDGWLQAKNAEERDPEDPTVESYVKDVMWPTWTALELFIDDTLIGRIFANEDQLRDALVPWPVFYREVHGDDPKPTWGRLTLDEDLIVVDSRSSNPQMIVAHVQRV